MKLAYNTNGFRYQPIDLTLRTLAEIGYQGVELGVRPTHIPPSSWCADEASRIKSLAGDLGLTITNLHLGAADLLSSIPFEPSFMAPHAKLRDQRVGLVIDGIDFAAQMGVDLVCFESGKLPEDMGRMAALSHLIDELDSCVAHAKRAGVKLAIEPHPQHFVDSYLVYGELRSILPYLDLCYDIGHAHCMYEDIPAVIAAADELVHVHFEDIKGRSRKHYHLLPGDGEMDLAAAIGALTARNFQGFVSVELPDHARDPAHAARRSFNFLQRCLARPDSSDRDRQQRPNGTLIVEGGSAISADHQGETSS